MSSLVSFVFSVGGLLAAIAAGVLWISVRPASRRARRFLFLVVVAYLLASIYVVPYGIGRLLVAGFHEFAASDVGPGKTAIVLLGGGGLTVKDWRLRRLSVLDAAGAARVLEAFRVFRLVPDATIISSGGPGDPEAPQHSDAGIMREALVQLGVPASRIVLEAESHNTHDEAVLVAPMLRQLSVDRVILVTSDTHMRRSLGAFRAQGVDALPAIARDPYLSFPWRERVQPTRWGLETSGAVAHEVIGLGYYAARGWLRF